MGMFVSSMAVAVRGTITWDSYPVYLTCEFPFIIALTKSNNIVIHNIMSQTLVQTIFLNSNIKINCFVDDAEINRFSTSLESKLYTEKDYNHTYSTLKSTILLSTENSIGGFFFNSIIEQVDKVLDSRKVEMAVLMTDEASSMLSEQSIHFYRMSQELQYVYQKCGLIYFEQTLLEDACFLLQRGKIDPRVLINLFPDLRDSSGDCDTLLTQQGVVLYPGIKDMISRMDTIQNLVIKSLYGDQEKSDPSKDLAVSALVSNARDAVIKFLVEAKNRRTGKQHVFNPEQLVAIDTALFKLYAEIDTSKIPDLLSSENNCDLTSCLLFVQKLQNLYLESLIYKSQNKPDKVFEIWKKLYGVQHLENDTKFNTQHEMSLDEIVQYLCIQTDSEIVKDVTDWLLKEDPLLAAQTIVKFPDNLFNMFDQKDIIQTLEDSIPLAKNTNEITGLEVFIEHLVSDRDNKDPEVHFKLGETYIRLLLANGTGSISHQNQMEQMEHSFLVARSIRPQITFMSFLESRNDRLSRRRLKLVKFLLNSLYYVPEKIVVLLSKTSSKFLFESAILNNKLGKHQAVLMYLIKLQDFVCAEKYCANGGEFFSKQGQQSSTISCQELLKILIRLYLEGDDEQKMSLQVKSLLENFEDNFQILEILDMLPSHWTFETFAPFLTCSLKKLCHRRIELQIIKGLVMSENIEINAKLASIRSKSAPIKIDLNDICGICQEVVGTDSVAVVNENKQKIYHHLCVDKALPGLG